MKFSLLMAHFIVGSCLLMGQTTELWTRVEMRTMLPVKEYLETPWRNSISEEKAEGFIKPLLQLIDSGVISVCRPEPPFNLPFSKKEVHFILHRYDTMNAENYNTGLWDTVIVVRSLEWNEIRSIDFLEKWELDPATGIFVKKVIGAIFRKPKISHITGDYLGDVPIFYIAFNMNSVKDPARWNNSSCYLSHSAETPLQLVNPGAGEKQNLDKMHSLLTPFLISATVAYDTTYPYYAKLPGKNLKELKAGRSVISDYLLNEYWSFSNSTFTFNKIVTGIVFRNRSQNRISTYAVVHLNKYQPQPLLQNEKSYPGSLYQQSLLFEQVPLSLSQFWYPATGIDSTACDHFFREVGEKTLKGKIPCFTSTYQLLPMDSVKRDHAFITRDTIMLEGTYNLETHVTFRSFLDEYPIGMKVWEQWFLDPLQGTFSKRICYFGATYQHKEWDRSEPYKVESKYLVPNTTLPPGKPVLLGKNVRSMAYLDLWLDRPIEDTSILVPLMQTPYFLSTMDKYQIVQGLIHACVEGKMVAMDPENNKVIKKNEVLTFLRSRIDSLAPFGHLQPEFKAIDHLEFEENWYRHEGTTDISKEVLSLTLVDMKTTYVDDRPVYNPRRLLKIVFKTAKK